MKKPSKKHCCRRLIATVLAGFVCIAQGNATEYDLKLVESFSYEGSSQLKERLGPYVPFIADGDRILRFDSTQRMYVPFHSEDFEILSVNQHPVAGWVYYLYGHTNISVPARVNVETGERERLLQLLTYEGIELALEVVRGIAGLSQSEVVYSVGNPISNQSELWFYDLSEQESRLIYANDASIVIEAYDPTDGYVVFREFGDTRLYLWNTDSAEPPAELLPVRAFGAQFLAPSIVAYDFYDGDELAIAARCLSTGAEVFRFDGAGSLPLYRDPFKAGYSPSGTLITYEFRDGHVPPTTVNVFALQFANRCR